MRSVVFQNYWNKKIAELDIHLSEPALQGININEILSHPNVESAEETPNMIKVIRVSDGFEVHIAKTEKIPQDDPLYTITVALNEYKLTEPRYVNIAKAVSQVQAYRVLRSQRDKYEDLVRTRLENGQDVAAVQAVVNDLTEELSALLVILAQKLPIKM